MERATVGLVRHGVRTVQLAHETNNDFTGAAYHRDLFEIMSQLKSWFDSGADYAEAADGVHNDIGLTSKGYELLREMIRLDMLIDISHLPLKTQRQIFGAQPINTATTHCTTRTPASMNC